MFREASMGRQLVPIGKGAPRFAALQAGEKAKIP
jgi:hypothetical protein